MTGHDSRWSDARGRQDDRRHVYGKNSRREYDDHYDAYDSHEADDYGGRDYQENYEQPTDLYENVPARNIARIQITPEEEERVVPQQRYRDYDQHTIDRPTRRAESGGERAMTESQRRTEMERNAERSRQQAEMRRREELEKQRRAEAERDAERKRIEAEQKKRQMEQQQRRQAETQRSQQREQQQQPPRREPHIRYEPGATPYQAHKQGIIDGFQQQKPKNGNEYREEDFRGQKKNDAPPAPPPPGSIKAIINNLKGNVEQKNFQKDDGRREIPRNKVSTNPFIRAGEKAPSPTRTPDTQPVKNVQEVVQKMNSGEWPIRVDDDDHSRDVSRPRSQQSFDNHKSPHGGQQKARHWEELERQSPDRQQDRRGERRGSRGEMAQRSTSSVRDVVRDAEEEQRRHGNHHSEEAPENSSDSEFSERSDDAQVTTVSTDSAMGSEEPSYPLERLSLPFELPQGTVLRKVPENVKELNDEAEKLLIYFKGHRNVLNYLGIGLSETLWNHIHALPDAAAEIAVQLSRSNHSNNGPGKKASPQITVTQPTFSPKHRDQSPRSPDRRSHPPSRPAQSPKMTALERQLCTDVVSPIPSQTPEEHQRNDARWNFVKKSGRFVKKSAAALIARKQGAALQSDDEPVSSDFVDSRIAAEIEQLRAREEELKRSRTQLGLPTLDDVIEGWRGPQPYFDYHRQMPEHRPISRSHSAHNLFIEERSPSQNYLREDGFEEQEVKPIGRNSQSNIGLQLNVSLSFQANPNANNMVKMLVFYLPNVANHSNPVLKEESSFFVPPKLSFAQRNALSRGWILQYSLQPPEPPVRRRVAVGRSASKRRLRRKKSSRKGPRPSKYAVSFSEIVTSIF